MPQTNDTMTSEELPELENKTYCGGHHDMDNFELDLCSECQAVIADRERLRERVEGMKRIGTNNKYLKEYGLCNNVAMEEYNQALEDVLSILGED